MPRRGSESAGCFEGHLSRVAPKAVGGLRVKVLSRGERMRGFSIFHITMPPRYQHFLLYHKWTHEWFYVLEGTTTGIIGGKPRRLRPGSFIYIAPGVPHIVSSKSRPVKVLVLFSPPMSLKKPDIHPAKGSPRSH